MFFNVLQAVDQGTLQTPFDEVYFPTDNTLHVEATDGIPASRGDNISFAKAEVNLQQGVGSPVLSTTFNYGEAMNDIVTHSAVVNNGKLHLYGNFNDSKTGVTPSSGNTQIYKLGNDCSSSNLIIEQGGELILGDASAGNKAKFIINEGASLSIKDNGKLKIEEGSELIIEDGANFSMGENAQIELLGANSSITIHGKLSLEANAVLDFTGPGRLIFDQNIPWIGDHLDLGAYYYFDPTSEVKIQGSPGSKKIVEIVKPLYFKDGQDQVPAAIEINNTELRLHSDAFLYLFHNFLVEHSDFTEAIPQQSPGHGGLRVFGNIGINQIRHCSFGPSSNAILAHWMGSNGPLRITDNQFDETSLKLESGRFELLRNDLNNTTVNSDGLQGFSKFNNNDFQLSGLSLNGSNQTTVEVVGNDFVSNGSGGGAALHLREIAAEVRCNSFENLHTGLGIDKEGSAFLHDDAFNYFYNNTTGINFTNGPDPTAMALYLSNGHNEFLLGPSHSNKLHLSGLFEASSSNYSANLPMSDYVFNATTGLEEMDADNNRFELKQVPCEPGSPCDGQGYNLVMPVSLSVQDDPGGSQNPIHLGAIRLHIPTNLASINSPCENPPPSGGEHPVHHYLQSISSPMGAGKIGGVGPTVRDIVLNAVLELSYQDQLNDDPAALNDFMAVLEGPITDGDASTDLFLAHSHNLMLLALENSFMHGFFPFAGEDPDALVHPQVLSVLEILDTALSHLQPTDSNYHHQHFRFHLDKVMSLRNGGHYGDALSTLNNSGEWTHNYEQQQRAGYWQCLCEAEGDYYSGALPAEEYTWEKQQCQIQYAGYNYKRSSTTEVSSEGYRIHEHSLGLSLYPLPAIDRLQLQFSRLLEEQIELSLHSLDGQLLRQEKPHLSGNRHTFALDQLATGVYILKVKTKAKHFNRKIVVQ